LEQLGALQWRAFTVSDYNIERSRKRKDYFTGCLPWPQKGTASFIADTGNLAVTTTSVPNYPFGHAFYFENENRERQHQIAL
jgi:hypothetical protein